MIVQPWSQGEVSDFRGLIFSDRDGVLVDFADRFAVKRTSVEAIPGVISAARKLIIAGYGIIVVTNQSAIGRGLVSKRKALRINKWIMETVDPSRSLIIASVICPHAPGVGCCCRKPNVAGLIEMYPQLEEQFTKTWFVGDQVTDMQAAGALGADGILVLTGHGRAASATIATLAVEPMVVDDFASAADFIVSNDRPC